MYLLHNVFVSNQALLVKGIGNLALLIFFTNRVPQSWVEALHKIDPKIDIRVWPEAGDPAEIDFVLAWNHPAGELREFPNLRCVQSLGAGVDHILRDPDLPQNVIVTRIVDRSLVDSMTNYLIAAVLNYLEHTKIFYAQQQERIWQPRVPINPKNKTIGIMGLGQLGRDAAQKLHHIGFPVCGWSRTRKKFARIHCFDSAQLPAFLGQTDILICLLPLTPATENILNRNNFKYLKQGAYLINVARGKHLVEQDLLEALDSGQLSGACLDVFRQEPLLKDHPFWQHPKITITPHISSVTDPQSAAEQIVENYRRLQAGKELLHVVDVGLGY
jgi:glyoxylate/hydroxypyruvate reductase A